MSEIACSFDTLYFKMKSDQTIKSLQTVNSSSLNFDNYREEKSEFDFSNIFYQRIKNHGKHELDDLQRYS